jgi:hypothetical protein
MRREHNEYKMMKAATILAVVTISLAVMAVLLVISPTSR